MADAEHRRRRILELLSRDGYESIHALSRVTAVSAMTIRRDLDEMEAEGLIRRTHGGAVTNALGQVSLDYAVRQKQHARAKRQIGRAAAGLVQDGDAVFLDAGTTVLAMTDFLTDRKELTVVTHSLPAVERLIGREGIEVFLLGGQTRRDLMSVVGYRTEEFLSTFRLDKAFLGTGGVDLERGLTHSTVEEIPIKKLAARIAQQVIVLADRSKIGRKGLMFYMPLSEIDLLITEGREQADIRIFKRKAAGRGRAK